MKYLVLMYGEESRWERATGQERETVMRAHNAFDAAVRERARMLGGEALAEAASSSTLRPAAAGGSRQVTDGPYAEAVEQLGGFYLVEAPDLDEMIALCQRLPDYYTIEIRPTVDVDL